MDADDVVFHVACVPAAATTAEAVHIEGVVDEIAAGGLTVWGVGLSSSF